MTQFADATISTDIINTLAALTLAHSFSAQDAADVEANGLFLRIFLFGNAPVISTSPRWIGFRA